MRMEKGTANSRIPFLEKYRFIPFYWAICPVLLSPIFPLPFSFTFSLDFSEALF